MNMNILLGISIPSVLVSCFLTFHYIPKHENDEEKKQITYKE